MIDAAIATLVGYLPAFVLASLRVALTFAALPAPFGAVAPLRIRTAFSLVTTAALILPQLNTLPKVPLNLGVLAHAGFYELFYGAVIGMTVRVTLAAAEVAGTASGHAMGLGFATSVDPTQGESVLPTTYLFDSLCTLIFLSFNCHHVLLAALAASFRVAPIGSAPTAAWSFGLVNLGADLVARGLQIAAPVMATMFIV